MPENPKKPALSQEAFDALEALGMVADDSEETFIFSTPEEMSLDSLATNWREIIQDKRFALLAPSQIEDQLDMIEGESDESIAARLADHYKNIMSASTEEEALGYWQVNQVTIQACLEAIALHNQRADELFKEE